jgi:site-specific DNA-methyltransferase (adenine-specific)
MKNKIIQGDCLRALKHYDDESFKLIYIDPPFNTGNTQKRRTLVTRAAVDGDRTGFGGKRYKTKTVLENEYSDSMPWLEYMTWLYRCLKEAQRVLTPTGSILLHLDWHCVHTVKANIMDRIWGRKHFINEIIWAYDFGGRSKKYWPRKHDNILWYVQDPKNYVFNYDAIDRIPYLAPGLVGAEKAARGKTPTDCMWQTIVPTNGKEKTGYPTQKPLALLQRLVLTHSSKGDRCLDFFAGSGTFGEACGIHERIFNVVDSNPVAIQIMRTRLKRFGCDITYYDD